MNLKTLALTLALSLTGFSAYAQNTPVDGPVSKSVSIADPYSSASEVESINVYGFVNIQSNISFQVEQSHNLDRMIGGINLADGGLNANLRTLRQSPAFTNLDCGNALDQAADDLGPSEEIYFLDKTTRLPVVKTADSSVACFVTNVQENSDNIRLNIRVGSKITIRNYRGPDAQLIFNTRRNSSMAEIGSMLFSGDGQTLLGDIGDTLVSLTVDGNAGSADGEQLIYLQNAMWIMNQTFSAGHEEHYLKLASREALGAKGMLSSGNMITYQITATNLYY